MINNKINREIIVFGASGGLKVAMDRLRELGIDHNVIFCCDNNSEIHGLTTNFGFKIYTPEAILEHQNAIVIITCGYYNTIYKQLRNMGAENEVYLTNFFIPVVDSSDMMSYTKDHFEEIQLVYNTDDNYTEGLLQLILRQRMESMEFINYEDAGCFEQILNYFYDKTISTESDITYYDVGAYDGKSILDMFELYGDRIKKVIAFEPELDNFNMLEKMIKQRLLGTLVKCLKLGLSDKDETLHFGGDKISARIDENGNKSIDVVALDNTVHSIIGDLLIKMDIEGSELAALRGACNLIKQYKPYLAICVYHKTKDILEIPQYLKSILQDYKFYLRGGLHTVLYAVPPQN